MVRTRGSLKLEKAVRLAALCPDDCQSTPWPTVLGSLRLAPQKSAHLHLPTTAAMRNMRPTTEAEW